MKIEPLIKCDTLLGEGPLWDVAEQRLYWIDSFGMKIFRATADGREIASWDVPQKIGAMALRQGGGAILSLADGFHFFDFSTGRSDPLHLVDHASADIRVNDGKVDKRGRYVSGSMDVTETTSGGVLYSVGTDLKVRTIDTGIVVSNGPCWSPDGSIFYFADSRSKTIWAYDYDLETGDIRGKRAFARFADDDGLPDGATVDAEGYIWSAGVYRGKLHRFAPDGSRDLTVDMPSVCVTSVMFGGPNLDILYVTSMARSPFPDVVETGPDAGSLFAITGHGSRGLQENRFGG